MAETAKINFIYDQSEKIRVAVYNELEAFIPVWDEAGFELGQIEDTTGKMLQTVLDSLKQAACLGKKQSNDVIELRSKIIDLCKDLHEAVPDMKPMENAVEKVLESLSASLKSLEDEKNRRMALLKGLREKERLLCERMAMEVSQFDEESVPSTDGLEKCQAVVDRLVAEEKTRREKFETMKTEVVTLLDRLEGSERSPDFHDMLEPEKNGIPLSVSFLDDLKEKLADLNDEKDARSAERNSLEASIKIWSRRLDAEDEYPLNFPENCLKTSTLQEIRALNDRVLGLRKDNLPKLVGAVRTEIVEFWDLLHYSDSERSQFELFKSDDFTAECLEEHDEELNRLRLEFEDKKVILERLDERKELLDHLEAIHTRENDPNRFKNRKAQILRDDKEGRKIIKKMPELEAEIQSRIDKWEKDTRKSFLIDGHTFERVLHEYRMARTKAFKHHCSCCVAFKETFGLMEERQTTHGKIVPASATKVPSSRTTLGPDRLPRPTFNTAVKDRKRKVHESKENLNVSIFKKPKT